MAFREYPDEQVVAQPIGYWSRVAYQAVVGRLRAELALQQLTQPHWWTLNHVAGGSWSRPDLADRLQPFDDLGIEFEDVFDDLIERGWLVEAETFTLTEAGQEALTRARAAMKDAHRQTAAGVTPEDYVVTINTLRRMVANLGGDSGLPADG